MTYELWRLQAKPKLMELELWNMQFKLRMFLDLILSLKQKKTSRRGILKRNWNRLWRGVFPLVIQAVTLYKYLKYHATVICNPRLRRKQ